MVGALDTSSESLLRSSQSSTAWKTHRYNRWQRRVASTSQPTKGRALSTSTGSFYELVACTTRRRAVMFYCDQLTRAQERPDGRATKHVGRQVLGQRRRQKRQRQIKRRHGQRRRRRPPQHHQERRQKGPNETESTHNSLQGTTRGGPAESLELTDKDHRTDRDHRCK